MLTSSEREIILAISDDEEAWTVYVDSRRKMASALLRLAYKWGAQVTNLGGRAREFQLPAKAVRFAAPRTPKKAPKNGG